MAEVPEKIWLKIHDNGFISSFPKNPAPLAQDYVQYIRADLHEAAVKEARQQCREDVCMYCAGHAPTHKRYVVGPNAAGNYVHDPVDSYNGTVRLCTASASFARERFEAAAAKEGE